MTAAAKRLTSAMKLSPTRMWITMQFGQEPSVRAVVGLAARALGLAGAVAVVDVVEGVVVVVEEVPADHVVDVAVAVVVRRRRSSGEPLEKAIRTSCGVSIPAGPTRRGSVTLTRESQA